MASKDSAVIRKGDMSIVGPRPLLIFKTVTVVFRHDGISSDTSATMEEFKG